MQNNISKHEVRKDRGDDAKINIWHDFKCILILECLCTRENVKAVKQQYKIVLKGMSEKDEIISEEYRIKSGCSLLWNI